MEKEKKINDGLYKNEELDEIILKLDPRGGTNMIDHLTDKQKSVRMCNYLANNGYIKLIEKDIDNKFSAKLIGKGISIRKRGGFVAIEKAEKKAKKRNTIIYILIILGFILSLFTIFK